MLHDEVHDRRIADILAQMSPDCVQTLVGLCDAFEKQSLGDGGRRDTEFMGVRFYRNNGEVRMEAVSVSVHDPWAHIISAHPLPQQPEAIERDAEQQHR